MVFAHLWALPSLQHNVAPPIDSPSPGSTAKAAANALALAGAISANSDLDAALQTWQRQQLDEGRRMGEWGVRMGNAIMGNGR